MIKVRLLKLQTGLSVNFTLPLYVLAGVLTVYSTNSFSQVLQNNDMSCPASPNCVSSSVDENTSHYIQPFSYNDAPDKAMARLKTALLKEKRVTIIESDAKTIQAQARSLIFHFIDNIKFYLTRDPGVIHVYSSSRSGYYDFGVNRRRVERIRKNFQIN